MSRNRQRTKQRRHANGKDDAGQTGAPTQKPLHKGISFGGIENEWESGRKTMHTGTEQRPANGRPRGPCGSWQPASRLGSCPKTYASSVPMLQKAPIGKFEHQSGKIDQTLERFAPGEAGGWSDSPQGVERIAPLGSLPTTSIGNRAHQSGIARTNREISARIGNGAHQSGNSSTNQESRARIGRRSGRAAREAQVDF